MSMHVHVYTHTQMPMPSLSSLPEHLLTTNTSHPIRSSLCAQRSSTQDYRWVSNFHQQEQPRPGYTDPPRSKTGLKDQLPSESWPRTDSTAKKTSKAQTLDLTNQSNQQLYVQSFWEVRNINHPFTYSLCCTLDQACCSQKIRRWLPRSPWSWAWYILATGTDCPISAGHTEMQNA